VTISINIEPRKTNQPPFDSSWRDDSNEL